MGNLPVIYGNGNIPNLSVNFQTLGPTLPAGFKTWRDYWEMD